MLNTNQGSQISCEEILRIVHPGCRLETAVLGRYFSISAKLLGESKKFKRLAGNGIKSISVIFRMKMSAYQSMGDGKTLFGKITHHLHPEIGKMLQRCMLGTRIPQYILVYNSPAIEIKIPFPKLAI